MRTILGGYKTYPWKEHDIVLDQLSRLYELAGVTKANGRPDIDRVAHISGLSKGTLGRWENRHVKRPQHAAIKAVIHALGAKYEMVYEGKAIRVINQKTRADVVAARAARMKASKKKGKKSHLRLVA